MKIRIRKRRSEEGALLPVVLFSCLIIGITLAAYLSLASSQHRAVVRSESWNSAIPVAEAGMEEALTQLHLNRTNLSANNWLTAANGLTLSNGVTLSGKHYYVNRSMDHGRYLVAISDDIAPVITSQAYVKAPITKQDIVRTVRITTAGGPTFARGLVAKGNIEWTGNILSDSFDSQDSRYSNNGRYDASKRRDNGSIGTVTGDFTMGGGIIYGSANTGPTGNFATGGGSVGDLAWITSGNTGVQPGHFSDDMNLSFPDVATPTGSFVIPPGGWVTNTTYSTNQSPIATVVYPFAHIGTIVTNSVTSSTYPTGASSSVATNVTTTTTGSGRGRGRGGSTVYNTNYTYSEFTYYTNMVVTNISSQYYDMVLASGNFKVLSIPNGTQMLVTGNALLFVETDINMQGQSQITIAQSGTLNLYVGGSAKLAGNGVINSTASATHFGLWGLPTCTSISLGGNTEFTGTIYAPNAHFHAGGGGNNRYDIVGSAIVGSAKFNGHFQFHYDEDLGKNGPRSAFVVTGWSEI